MKNLLMVSAALISTAGFAPAIAGTVSGIVHVGDLDLSTQAGRATFEHRVASTARRICRVQGDRSLVALNQSRKCRAEAVASARHQLANGATSVFMASL